MILYTIEKDGCLSGIYTNEHQNGPGKISGETARKKDDSSLPTNLEGIYDSVFFEHGNPNAEQCELEIDCKNIPFTLAWKKPNAKQPLWEGYGYKMRDNLLVVHYWSK